MFSLEGPQAPTETCQTSALALHDTFEPASLRPNWSVFKSSPDQTLTAEIEGSRLALFPGVGGAVAVASDFAYDLELARFAIRVEPTAPLEGENLARFGLLETAPTDLEAPGARALSVDWTLKDNRLVPTSFDGTAWVDRAVGFDYDVMTHRYLAISREDGVVRWEVSSDNRSFTSLYSDELPLRMLRPYMLVDRPNSGFPSVKVFFDDLNLDATGEICAMDALVSTFRDEDPLQWFRYRESSCRIDVAEGVRFLPEGTSFECDYVTTGMYDLIEHSLDVVVETTQLEGEEDSLHVKLESFDRTFVAMTIYRQNGALRLRGTVTLPSQQEMTVFDIPDPGDRFWRISGKGVVGDQGVTWLSSADGVMYTEHFDFGGLTGFQQTRVLLGVVGRDAGTRTSFASVGLRR